MKSLIAQLYGDVKKYVTGTDSFRMGIDYEGNLILLTSTKNGSMYHHDIYHFLRGEINHIKLPGIYMRNFSSAQPLHENWILVEALGDEDAGPKNAYVFDTDGYILNSYTYGEAVEDVQTTVEGDVWVSYFDQGCEGLHCYKDGVKTFDYYYSIMKNNPNVPTIDDCYALNVTPDSTNIYYYSDFPFVQIRGENEFKMYEDIPIQGSKAFAIRGNDVLFSQDYDAKPEVYLYSLEEKKKMTFKTIKPDGSILNYDDSIGRGTKLFLIQDTEVYLVDLKNLITK